MPLQCSCIDMQTMPLTFTSVSSLSQTVSVHRPYNFVILTAYIGPSLFISSFFSDQIFSSQFYSHFQSFSFPFCVHH